MEKFNILKSVPANLPMMNVDTDMIIPKQFLKTIKRSGLGKSLFFEMRYDEQGKKMDEFVLNKELSYWGDQYMKATHLLLAVLPCV